MSLNCPPLVSFPKKFFVLVIVLAWPATAGPVASAQTIDLADIVGGGDGSGTGQNSGIDLVTGSATTTHESDVSAPTNTYTLADNPLVDGVFIPDGGKGGWGAHN